MAASVGEAYFTSFGNVTSGMPKAAVPVSPNTTSPGCRNSAMRSHTHDWVIFLESRSCASVSGGRVGMVVFGNASDLMLSVILGNNCL